MDKERMDKIRVLSTGQHIIGIIRKSDLIEQDKLHNVTRGSPLRLNEYSVKESNFMYIGKYAGYTYPLNQIDDIKRIISILQDIRDHDQIELIVEYPETRAYLYIQVDDYWGFVVCPTKVIN